jgi:hypothetical protein
VAENGGDRSPPGLTRIAVLGRPLQVAVAVAVLAAALAGLDALQPAQAVTEVLAEPASAEPTPSDWAFYRRVVARLQAGEPYYQALGDELRAGGFPTGSAFYWRPPLHLSMLAWMPHPLMGQALLVLAAILTAALAWTSALRTGGLGPATGTLVFLLGAFLPCFAGDFYLFSELWAGVLVTCSAYLLAFGRWRSAVAVGLFAALLRELAVLLLVVGLLDAIRRRHRVEAWSWAGALGIFAVALGVHIASVDGGAGTGAWMSLGGPGFILASARMHTLLLLAPAWVTAWFVPLALLGLLAWPDDRVAVLKLTTVGFVLAFMVVGRPVNYYWGLIYAPLLATSIAWAPRAVRDLARALNPRPTPMGA